MTHPERELCYLHTAAKVDGGNSAWQLIVADEIESTSIAAKPQLTELIVSPASHCAARENGTTVSATACDGSSPFTQRNKGDAGDCNVGADVIRGHARTQTEPPPRIGSPAAYSRRTAIGEHQEGTCVCAACRGSEHGCIRIKLQRATRSDCPAARDLESRKR